MSPEMVTGRAFDHRSDVFSLGVLLFEAVTRKHLFLVRDELQTLLNVRDCQVAARLEKHASQGALLLGSLARSVAFAARL